MTTKPRIYLDHAATSWPKCTSVIQAMTDFMRDCGAAAGRGGYASAAAADRIVTTTRRQIAALVGAESTNSISLHSNGTTALNAAIHGVLKQGDHVVTCAAEHNSVLRPLHCLQQRGEIKLTIVPVDQSGKVDPQQLLDATRPNTRMVTLTHASNVTGAVQPVAEIATALRDRSTLFLCDAAQTFGTLPIDVDGIDLLAAPGHKASGGPLGTGFLYVATQIEDQVEPSIQGGTGSQSESLEMPINMPSKLEPGNLNVPALAGWSVALKEVMDDGIETRQRQAIQLSNQLHDALSGMPGLRVYGERDQLPIASISIDGLTPSDAAVVLDSEYGIETRAGLHCAGAIHSFLGSQDQGTLRISAGHETKTSDITKATEALQSITGMMQSLE
ncbi:aminotransferase class V-fold PLP-dependent enzyme [Rubripirellula sp.]|nr:aminotransferase class V-fold PLP-dependent enzyme [Planctomycetaceae bacterium]MDA9857605.1 aminotransferase class V-fold PLP-dependent enzyme [Rubripirellula sp.]